MSKSLVIFCCCLSFLFFGCKKKLTQFHLEYQTSAVIPATFGTLIPFSIATPETATNASYEFESNDTRKDHIRSIYLKKLSVEITNPTTETFSFVNAVSVYIDSPNQNEVLIASKSNIPDTIGNILVLDLNAVDLQQLIKDDSFSLRLNVVSDETIPQDVSVQINTDFLVDAQLIRSK